MRGTILQMRRQWLLGSTSSMAIAAALEASRREAEERARVDEGQVVHFRGVTFRGPLS